MNFYRALQLGGVSSIALLIGPAIAQSAASQLKGQLAEIVVTAQKVSANRQKTPITVEAVSGKDLAASPVSDLRAALATIPSVAFNNQGNFGMQVIARGIGPGILNGPSGVSSLIDGVYSASQISTIAGYYDMARIEVLLGPQGTLYGRNAEGGVVNLVTSDPVDRLANSLSVGFGNYNLINAQAMTNLPLTDQLFLRIAATVNERKGYLSNGQDDNGSVGVRAKLLYKPSDRYSLLLGAEDTVINDKGVAAVPAFVSGNSSDFTVPYTGHQHYRDEGYRIWANLSADAGIGDLAVIPAYTNTAEATQATDDLVQLNPFQSVGFGSVTLGRGSLTEESVEARLAAKRTSPLQWIIGVYDYHSADTSPGDDYTSGFSLTESTITLAPGTLADNTDRKQDSQGYFAQVSMPVTAALHLLGGLRYSTDHASYFNNGVLHDGASQAADWSHIDYRLGAQYDVAKNSLAYFTYATGYRPGGFSLAPPYPSYGVETVKSYELGSKNQFLDNSLRVNADIYHYDYQGYQQVTFQACDPLGAPPVPGLPSCTGVIPINLVIQNAKKVEVNGGEVSIQYLPTPNDHLTLAGAYNNSKFESLLVVGLFPAINVEGEHLPQAPLFSGTIAYAHDFSIANGTATPSLTLRYTGEQTLALPSSPIDNQAAVTVVDAGLSYGPDAAQWRVNLWGKNLTNQVIKASSSGTSVNLAPPRTYGATFSTNF